MSIELTPALATVRTALRAFLSCCMRRAAALSSSSEVSPSSGKAGDAKAHAQADHRAGATENS